MTDTKTLKEDIAYVRAVAERSESLPMPAAYLVWAVLWLCGFALVDFVGPESVWVGVFWLVAAPAGFGLSGWIAERAQRQAGQADHQENRRWSLHFLAFFTSGLLGFGLVAAGQLTWAGFISLWILLLGLTYFQAGLYLERRLLPIGLLVGVGYLVTLLVPEYGFTTAGVLVAAGLTLLAFLETRVQRATN